MNNIINEISPSQLRHTPLSVEKIGHLQNQIKAETARIISAFIQKVFSIKKEKKVELYIQQHQHDLIRIKDQLFSYIPTEERNNIYSPAELTDSLTLYKYIYIKLEKLLTYIEKHFSKYFCIEAKLPDRYRIMTIRNMKEKIKKVPDRFKAKGINPELLQQALHPVNRFILDRNKEEAIYRRLIYLKAHVKELLELSNLELTGQDFDQKVICSLSYLNYNCSGFFDYYTSYIKSQYQGQETLYEQLEQLALIYKNLRQTQVKPCFAYEPENGILTHRLVEWLDEEILFLEKKHQLSLPGPAYLNKDLPKNVKITTDLSVSQLAYFVKVLIEIGVIKNKNHTEILKYLSRVARTKRVETISADSLRSKFYNVEDSTRNAIKDLLINMLNIVRKN